MAIQIDESNFNALITKYGLEKELINEEIIANFSKYIEERSFPKKTILLKQGKICSNIYFIKKGLARNYFENEGKELTTDISIDGDLLVAFSSFIAQKPSIESIEILEDSILYSINYNDLENLYRTFPSLERVGRKMAEFHYNSLANHTFLMKFSNSKERYKYLFDHKIEVIKRAPIGIIASYLGMKIETLSRIRNK